MTAERVTIRRGVAGLLLAVAVGAIAACTIDPAIHVAKKTEPAASPSPSPTPVASPTGAATPSASPVVPSPAPSASPVPGPSAAPGASPTPAPTLTPPPTPTPFPTPTPNGYTTSWFSGNGAPSDDSQPCYVDGPAARAGFREPTSLAFQADGSLLVSDYRNHAIRQLTATGDVTTITGAPPPNRHIGHVNGKGTNAFYFHMCQVAVGTDGKLYAVEDWYQDIRAIDPANGMAVTTLTGWADALAIDDGSKRTGGFKDGDRNTALFRDPYGIAQGPDGKLYVADTENNCIRQVSLPDGTVQLWAGKAPDGGGAPVGGFADGPRLQASFDEPYGLAFDTKGNLFVADASNNRIRMIDPTGNVTTVAGGSEGGFVEGAGADARFSYPMGVAIDGSGNLVVADTRNHRIRRIDMASPAHTVTTLAGSGLPGYFEGPALRARFSGPQGVAVSATGDIFVADTGNNRIRRIAK